MRKSDAPGPGIYETMSPEKPDAPAYGFGSTKRKTVRYSSPKRNPGPGSYDIKPLSGLLIQGRN